MTKRIVIISDTQFPYEDRRAVSALINYIGDQDPDEVVHIGDLLDFPQPSSWSKGTAAEFEGSVFEDAEYTKAKFLAPLREAYDGPIGILEGNHDERPRVYLAKYAPALVESGAFKFEQLCDFDGFGIDRLPHFYDFAPGWTITHGHKGGIRLSQSAGATALGAAKKFMKSVIMGHTHRLGAIPHTYGYDARVEKTLWGIEVGNLMSMRLAQYLKGGTANWQQGFAVVDVHESGHVAVQTVPISEDRFVVDGEVFAL